jgi:hypothetical protein
VQRRRRAGFVGSAVRSGGKQPIFPHERGMNRPISAGSVAFGQDAPQSTGKGPQSGGPGSGWIEDENEPMALALTILAIALASLALGVQLADLRSGRGRPALLSLARAGNDNAAATRDDSVTLIRPKIVPASITRRSAHR